MSVCCIVGVSLTCSTIHVKVHYEGSNAVVTVQDTGVGIPRELSCLDV